MPQNRTFFSPADISKPLAEGHTAAAVAGIERQLGRQRAQKRHGLLAEHGGVAAAQPRDDRAARHDRVAAEKCLRADAVACAAARVPGRGVALDVQRAPVERDALGKVMSGS